MQPSIRIDWRVLLLSSSMRGTDFRGCPLAFGSASFHGPIMRVSFQVILPYGRQKTSDLLSAFVRHFSSSSEIATEVALACGKSQAEVLEIVVCPGGAVLQLGLCSFAVLSA